MTTETTVRPSAPTATTDQGDHERLSHYVWVPPEAGITAQAYVLQARVEGTPVRALCGKVWVPERDPQRYPVCPECKEIKDRATGG